MVYMEYLKLDNEINIISFENSNAEILNNPVW